MPTRTTDAFSGTGPLMTLRGVFLAGVFSAVAVVLHLQASPASADEPNWIPDQKCVDTAELCATAAPCLSHGAQCSTCTHAGRFHQECRTGATRQCAQPSLVGGSDRGCGHLVQSVRVNFGSTEQPDFQCVGSIILETECMRFVCSTRPDPGS